MPALKAIISADAQPYYQELTKVEQMAKRFANRVENIRSGGGATGGHGAGGIQSGVMRESLVVLREMSRGNWSRVPGSISILAQQMGLMKHVLKDTAGAADVLADAWQKQAEKAGVAAIASTRKAAAATAALYAEGGETEANLAEAVAAEEKAAADIRAAQAAQAKAVASAESAAAMRAEGAAATFTLGPIGLAIAAVVALAAVTYSLFKYVQKTADALASLKPPDVQLDYISKTEQAINAAKQAQEQLTDEVNKTADAYHSAAHAAKLMQEATEEHFEHQRKMTDIRERTDLAGAETPEERAGIRAQYAEERIKTADKEREAIIKNKIAERDAYIAEAAAKKKEADEMKISSAKHDEQLVKNKKETLDTFKKQLAEFEATAQATPDNLKALKGKKEEVADAEEFYKRAVDQSEANAKARKKRDDIYAQGRESSKKARALTEEIPELQTKQARQHANQVEEENAKLGAEAAGDKPKKDNFRFLQGHLTELQRVGGYAGPAAAVVKDPAKKSEIHLAKIEQHTAQMARSLRGDNGPGLGGVQF